MSSVQHFLKESFADDGNLTEVNIHRHSLLLSTAGTPSEQYTSAVA